MCEGDKYWLTALGRALDQVVFFIKKAGIFKYVDEPPLLSTDTATAPR
jgi:hypothetical protein